MHHRTFELASSIVVSLVSDDGAAAHWLEEYVTGWFIPGAARPDWNITLRVDAGAYAAVRARQPAEATLLPCFAFDTHVLSLPAWRDGHAWVVEDAERSCCLRFTPSNVELIADPDSNRWRFTSILVLLELAATRLRRTSLDLHAAAIAVRDRGLLIIGPKGAGKTTLALQLLRAGGCQWMANDRAFVRAADRGFALMGIPTVVKIRAAAIGDVAQLRAGLGGVARPYLLSLDELAAAVADDEPATAGEIALSPPQVLRRLTVQPRALARLAAIVVPHLDGRVDGHTIDALSTDETAAQLWANLYGNSTARAQPTVVEELDGGRCLPSAALVEELACSVRGYRLRLGHNAYDRRDLPDRLDELVACHE